MVFPGTGSHSPRRQSRSSGSAIEPGVSCWIGTATRSFTGSGRCRRDSSVTLRASASNASQSLFDSQHGGTAACRGWMNVWRSVVLRSSFSYQVAAGRTRSE